MCRSRINFDGGNVSEIMRFEAKAALAVLLLGISLPRQSAATLFRTFEIRGVIRTLSGSVVSNAEVQFERADGAKISQTVSSDKVGFYKAQLSVGLYTMTVVDRSDQSLQKYRRPLFRVTSPRNIVLNITLYPAEPHCDPVIPFSGPALTAEGYADICGGWDFLPAPSKEGVPFELFVRYSRRRPTNEGRIYLSDPSRGYRVFVAYNLFSLYADQVVYDGKSQRLEAIGDVVTTDQSGKSRRADSMTLKIADGLAVPRH